MRLSTRLLFLASWLVVAACTAGSSDDGEEEGTQDLSTDGGTVDSSSPAADAGSADSSATVVDSGTTADASSGDAGTQSDVTFVTVKPILEQRCNGCHQGAFSNISVVKTKRARMIQLITAGRMPKGNPTWKDTEEGLLVLGYLQTSAELQ